MRQVTSVNMIILEAFPDATDAFLYASLGYYSTLKGSSMSAFEKFS